MPDSAFRWDPAKNIWLKKYRNLSFEAVILAAENGNILDDYEHPTRPNQCVMVVEINQYLCAVPYVKDGDIWFLKTIYPNRELYQKYGRLK